MPPAERPAIANSTAIISLALLGRLDPVRHLYREVLIRLRSTPSWSLAEVVPRV